jgi:ribonucleoside-diphosphate reductase beta chain
MANIATKVNLLEANGVQPYRPLIYPWAFEAWKKQQQMHWLPEEVTMSDDINDWKNKLTDEDRNFLTNVFRLFTQADIDVNDCYMKKYSQVFKPIEITMMLSAFSNIETIHIEGYSYLIESLSMSSSIYTEFLEFQAMREKHDYLDKFNTNTKEGIATTLAMYGAFTEGLQLFSSFALLLNYYRHGLMKGMGQIVTWSFRDETLHTQSMAKLFKTLIQENPELWTKKLQNEITEACQNVVKFEDAFIELCFNTSGNSIRNLDPKDVEKYIRYLADRRLNSLGLPSLYNVDNNPLVWVDEITSNVELANFFESRVTEYSKSSMTGTWDEAF